ISTAAMLALLSVGSMTFMSCDKTEDCEVGYEGKNCDVEVRAKFVGIWSAQDTEVGGADLPAYTANITKHSSNISKLNIGGFSGLPSNGGFAANVEVSADGTRFSIPAQEPDADGFQVSGSGTINSAGTTITVEYTIKNTATNQALSYTGVWNK